MDYVRSNFGTNEPLQVEQKWGKKCSTDRGSFVPNLLHTKSIF